jgi:serine/threonine protein phosphatase 1
MATDGNPVEFPAGKSGRLLAIGDIHGCHVAFDTLLEHLTITPSDTVVVLGDVIDRGPGTRQVIDRLIELRNRCRLIFLMGNHEELFLDSIRTEKVQKLWKVQELWMGLGGLETLLSYGQHAADTGEIPHEHIDFLKSGLDYFETEATVFVHANLEPGRPLAQQKPEWLRWSRLTEWDPPLPTGQRVICGHTSQKSGQVWIANGRVCIDTYAYGGGFLTALDVDRDLVYQSRQTGEFRGPISLAASAESA